MVAAGATAALVGIALSVAVDADFGAWLTIGGLLTLLWALHRFGRSGPG